MTPVEEEFRAINCSNRQSIACMLLPERRGGVESLNAMIEKAQKNTGRLKPPGVLFLGKLGKRLSREYYG